MPSSNAVNPVDERDHPPRALTFTPAEWRHLLEDPSFLAQDDNSYSAPRRLMGLPVEIVPDHELGA
ncbi:MAG: hypothetical protein ACYC8V_14170 [Caulobacteraceae bacterium]